MRFSRMKLTRFAMFTVMAWWWLCGNAATPFNYEDLIYEPNEDGTCTLLKAATYWRNPTALPSVVYDDQGKAYTVTKIAEGAFVGKSGGGDGIICPSTLKRLDKGAFTSSSFVWVVMYDGVESLGEKCFSQCGQLRYVRLSKSLKSLPVNCFMSCHSLECVRIPDNVGNTKGDGIGAGAFAGCEKLKVLVLNNLNAQAPYYLYDTCKFIYSMTDKSSGYFHDGKPYPGLIFCPIGSQNNYLVDDDDEEKALVNVYEFDMKSLKGVMYPYWADLSVPEEFLEY